MRRLFAAVTSVLAIPTLCIATPVVDGSRLSVQFVPGGLNITPVSSLESKHTGHWNRYAGLTSGDVARIFASVKARDDTSTSRSIFLMLPVSDEASIPSLTDVVPWAGPAGIAASESVKTAAREDDSRAHNSLGSENSPGFGSGSGGASMLARRIEGGSLPNDPLERPILGSSSGSANHSGGGTGGGTGNSNVTRPGENTSGDVAAFGNLAGAGVGSNSPGAAGSPGTVQVLQVPTSPALWLVGSSLIGLAAFRIRRRLKQ